MSAVISEIVSSRRATFAAVCCTLSVVLLGWNRSRDVRHEQTGRGQPRLEVGVVGRDGGATVIERGQLVQEAQADVVHVVGSGTSGRVATHDEMDG